MIDAISSVRQQLEESVHAIAARTSFRPSVGLILGSGLGGLTKELKPEAEFEYADIPHMPQATAPGHEGKLSLGLLGGQRVAVLSGRFHYYEGHPSSSIAYPIRLIRALGAQTLFLTSIVGSMNPKMPPGSLMMLDDHLNLMSMNPLVGPNDETVGPRFPDMSRPYDSELQRLARQAAKEQRLPLHEGVYVAVTGPNLETRAEYRFLRQIGADVVGMSMVPEVLVARHCGMRVLAVTVVSDACNPDALKPASIDELLRVAAETEPKLTALLKTVLQRLTV